METTIYKMGMTSFPWSHGSSIFISLFKTKNRCISLLRFACKIDNCLWWVYRNDLIWLSVSVTYDSLSDFCNGRYLWFSPGTLVPSIDKNDHHDITEILLKVALNNNTQTQTLKWPEWDTSSWNIVENDIKYMQI